jgi:hypothetical protein
MESPFLCDMTALTSDQRARHRDLAEKLRRALGEVEELPDGYAFRFAMEPSMLLQLAEFITLERLCCPCFTLILEAQRDHGPLSLKVTGREGVKAFIRAEFGIDAGPSTTRS